MRCHALRCCRAFASRLAGKGGIVLACLGAIATVLAVFPTCGGRPSRPAAARHTAPRSLTERHDVPEVAPRPPFKKLWESRETDSREWLSEIDGLPIIVTDDAIYRPLAESYVATDLRTGKRLWQKTTAHGYPSDLAYDGETLYLVMGNNLLAVVPRTGKQRWSLPIKKLGAVPYLAPAEPFPGFADPPYRRFATPPEYSTLPAAESVNPVAARPGLLVYECGHFCIAALNTRTRKTSWAVRLPVESFAIDAHFPVRVRPIMVGDRWLIVTDEGGIYGIEMQTGQLLWQYPDGRHYDVAGIAADSSRVYYAAVMGEMGALDVGTGLPLWKRETKEPVFNHAPPLPLGNISVFVAVDGVLHAVNAADGTRRWDFTPPNDGGLGLLAPTAYGGQIFLHTGATLMALDTSGRKIWAWNTPEEDTLRNPMRVTVFKDGVLLHEWGTFIYYAMTKSAPGSSGRTGVNQ